MKDNKTVTNLMLKICKLRDVIESRDFKTILKNLQLFQQVQSEVKRQLAKYITTASHELARGHQSVSR